MGITDLQRIQVIDSHTGGEPTRVVIAGGPNLGGGTVAARREFFQREYDWFRSAVVCEPRGSDVLVGALLVEPSDPSCDMGVIFFNNAGTLGMCGHGTIGLMVTLSHQGRILPGACRIETPVGVVTATLHLSGRVSFQNVPSYRFRRAVTVPVEGHGPVTGDVAWGGNWFFLSGEHGQTLERARVAALTDFTQRVRRALAQNGITGQDGAEIDHIELFGPPSSPNADSRNFVLCPGGAYDRSPCGTGTSAKLACLFGDGKLREGEIWRQESIVGSIFEGSVQADAEQILPTITGSAFVTAESALILNPNDPFSRGIRSP